MDDRQRFTDDDSPIYVETIGTSNTIRISASAYVEETFEQSFERRVLALIDQRLRELGLLKDDSNG